MSEQSHVSDQDDSALLRLAGVVGFALLLGLCAGLFAIFFSIGRLY